MQIPSQQRVLKTDRGEFSLHKRGPMIGQKSHLYKESLQNRTVCFRKLARRAKVEEVGGWNQVPGEISGKRGGVQSR